MAASFANIAFKLYLPTCLQYDDHIAIKFKFEYKQTEENIIYYNSILTDQVAVSHTDKTTHRYPTSEKIFFKDSIIFKNGKKIFPKKSTLKMNFLSNTGIRTEVSYSIDSSLGFHLQNVATFPMTELEKEIYEIYSIEHSECEYSNSKSNLNIPKASVSGNDILGLQKYRDALKTEKHFLMNEGGRKYKVTNGKLISDTGDIFSYVFDLETELHISDNAPVKVSTSYESSSGIVLMCEDFQIIIELKSNIGNRVGSALISVEPWKLLEAIEERLHSSIDIHSKKLCTHLLTNGPLLATKKPIEEIPKGQEAVIQKAMTEPVCIVWGPPGTGKTHTMSELAIKFMHQGKRVLIVSHSNVSVDGVAKKIGELLSQKKQINSLQSGKVFRYGYIRDEDLNKNPFVNSFYYSVSKNPILSKQLESLQREYDQIKHTQGLTSNRIIKIRKEISKIRGQVREQEHRYVSNASIVATTISKIIVDPLFKEKQYDVVMFDEVSMAYVLQVVCAATFAKEHLICVGDFMQLAPIAQSGAKEILCEDIFSFLGINQHETPYYHPWLVMLNEQRRMHPKISAFANKYVYNKLLKDHPSTLTNRNDIVSAELFKEQAINLINLSGTYCAAAKNADNSRYNILSAFFSFALAVKTESNVDNVSIITPYAAQTRLIRALTLDYRQHGNTKIRCATVHQFQGSESDVVFFDAVESYPAKKPGWLMGKDFNSIRRLINVAVTRARGKLVVVANDKFWRNNYKQRPTHTLYRLLEYLTSHGNVVQHKDVSLEELIKNISLKDGLKFFSKPEQYLNLLIEDLEKAKMKIVISLPSGFLTDGEEEVILSAIRKARMKGLRILIKSNDYENLPCEWKKYTLGTDNATFPIIMVDDKVTWYGAPLAPWKFIDGSTSYLTVCPIICRVKGEHTAEMIRSLSDLEYKETKAGKTELLPKNEKSFNNSTKRDGNFGLAAYINENYKCPVCTKPVIMTRGKSGKTILWCKECKKTSLLTIDDINRYMLINHIRCSQHNCKMTAKLGKYGLYIRCNQNHYLKPEEI